MLNYIWSDVDLDFLRASYGGGETALTCLVSTAGDAPEYGPVYAHPVVIVPPGTRRVSYLLRIRLRSNRKSSSTAVLRNRGMREGELS